MSRFALFARLFVLLLEAALFIAGLLWWTHVDTKLAPAIPLAIGVTVILTCLMGIVLIRQGGK